MSDTSIALAARTRAAVDRRIQARNELRQAWEQNEAALNDLLTAAGEMLSVPLGWQYVDGAFVPPPPEPEAPPAVA